MEAETSVDIEIEKLYPNVAAPEYKSDGSSGLDLKAYTVWGDNTPWIFAVQAGMKSVKIPTGLKISIPDNYFAMITTGQELLKNTTMRVSGGSMILGKDINDELVIYFDNIGEYIGECGHDDVIINHGDVIARLIVLPCPAVNFKVKEFSYL